MNDDVAPGICAVLFCGLMLFIGVGNPVWQYWRGVWSMEAQAIEAGVAEYRIDSTTGDKSFVWLNCKATQ